MTRSLQYLLIALAVPIAASACGKPQPVAPPPAPRAEERPRPAQNDDEAERERLRAEDEARRQRAAEEARLRSLKTLLEERIHFDFDKSDIRSDARTVMDRKVEALMANPGLRLRIEGHADERGSDEYNMSLGMRRAMAAKQYCTLRGIDPGRIEILSYGEERPMERTSNETAWSRNRRDEFVVTTGLTAAVNR